MSLIKFTFTTFVCSMALLSIAALSDEDIPQTSSGAHEVAAPAKKAHPSSDDSSDYELPGEIKDGSPQSLSSFHGKPVPAAPRGKDPVATPPPGHADYDYPP